jgi:S1-C subfamily serine protease
VGLQGGDVIIGIDGKTLDITEADFRTHVRRNYLVGDRITLTILRKGKRIDLGTLTLR